MADNITKISSEYDLVDTIQNIGRSYFGNDISTQRIGTFGMIAESMAHGLGATLLDSSIRSAEYNLTSAKLRSTLLCEAPDTLFIDHAVPSSITAYIAILADSISKYGTETDGDFTFILEKDTTYSIDEYVFMLEHDIQIRALERVTTAGEPVRYNYIVKYMIPGDTDSTSVPPYLYPNYVILNPLESAYISSYVSTDDDGNTILIFPVTLREMTKVTKYYTVVENDAISLTGVDFSYDNQLSHFNIYYKENSSVANWTYIPVIHVSKRYLLTSDTNKIFYEIFHDNGQLRLDIINFTPKYNSEFKVEIYTTSGNDSNTLAYTGTGEDVYVKLLSPEDRHIYAGLDIACRPAGSAEGGKNIPTIDQLREAIIAYRSTLNSVNTEHDMQLFMANKDEYNNYVFIKRRNDILERLYTVYSILRKDDGSIIRTGNLDIRNNIVIPAGAELLKSEDPDEDEEDDFFISPYTVIYDVENNIVSTFNPSIDEILPVSETFSDSSADTMFVTKTVKVERNAMVASGKDTYRFIVSVALSGNADFVVNGDDNNSGTRKNMLQVLLAFENKDGIISDPSVDEDYYGSLTVAFLLMKFDSVENGIYTFIGDLTLEESATLSSKYIHVTGLTHAEQSFGGWTSGDTCRIPVNDLDYRLYFYYPDFTDIPDENSPIDMPTLDSSDSSVSYYKDRNRASSEYPGVQLQGALDKNGSISFLYYTFANEYKNINKLNLYDNISDTVRIYADSYDAIDGKVDFKSLPIIHVLDMNTSTSASHIIRLINNSIKSIRNLNEYVHPNNTDFDYKFFRTAGNGELYQLQSSDPDTEDVRLDDLYLTIEVLVSKRKTMTMSENDLINSVKTQIKTYIESFNHENNDLDYSIHLSNMTTAIENELDDQIRYVDITKINGLSNYRIIAYIPPENKANYVPEYLHIDINNINVTVTV